ncbi:hypothetical protein [Rhodovulum strictum]|uniref:Uncharacterized protein n=1 Tax=Rhodovulum strictum TaxID=58314 RepID=A0A844BI83_9RHOB|nr:hypothetical protein [Rhodovulum strictum]MRH20673.1 hypothetical protein [Rhodovulum strictum]
MTPSPPPRLRLALCAALVALGAAPALADRVVDGPLRPKVEDLSAYRDHTRAALGRMNAAQPDPCIANVAGALFLDAHLADTGLIEALRGLDRPEVAVARIVWNFAMPDEPGVLGSLATVLGYGKIGKALDLVSKGANTIKGFDILMEHTIGSVEQRQAIWTNEIVRQSIDNKWDATLIADRSRQLADSSQTTVEEIRTLSDRTEAEILDLERKHEAEIARIDARRSERIEALIQKHYSLTDTNPQRAMLQARLKAESDPAMSTIANEHTAATQTALNNRYAKLTEISQGYERRVGKLTEDLARNATQHEALARYAWPIAQGDCAEITRDGPVAAIPRLPTGLEEPYERDAADAGRLADVLKLPHDKLMVTLGALALAPSTDFLSCVCRAAAYGQPQTAQFYHPDTIGEYDKRYSCNTPGEPCVVSGFGCWRNPLPGNPDYWEACADRMQGEAAQPFTDSILSRMKARRTRLEEAPQ